MSKDFGTDLTVGSIPRHLLGFSLPMLAGNLIQIGHNIINTIWVGHLVGEDAVGAAGVGDTMGAAFQFSSQFIAGFVIAFSHNAKVAAVILLVMPVTSVFLSGVIYLIVTLSKRTSVANEEASTIADEALSGRVPLVQHLHPATRVLEHATPDLVGGRHGMEQRPDRGRWCVDDEPGLMALHGSPPSRPRR